ncbi:GTP pyrophosphokinase ppGpp synthetase I [Georgfuchsia toluolica]|uniref:GTP pyrophosphokinase n=1 Tax=Georgfuchsia toluolica TaxID=424218 RepID=A0A916NHX4_9PROT|nr:bifunctional (p)ppGpp synthetase/guanosine-3',5'-bis(diphosphate) 3'-pyrophosphohydrolase [Georgfuchsia toluolica]CAG4883871.1 GTP pyrophosphokinase ppGpp synthetase I [Georgfuchsia toluolica]
MVSVVHALPTKGEDREVFGLAARGLNDEARLKLLDAWNWVSGIYGERKLGTGEPVLPHAQAMAVILAGLDLDLDTRIAALLFNIDDTVPDFNNVATQRYGAAVAELVTGLERLAPLRLVVRNEQESMVQQTEVLRKMMLAMVADIRVVLLRLASRTQTLRWLVDHETPLREESVVPPASAAGLSRHPGGPSQSCPTGVSFGQGGPAADLFARESLDVFAPLANRLGIWQFKWELEDLSLRLLEPATYKRIAKMLDERRIEREQFIANVIERVKRELKVAGIDAEVIGRPKHIYSIWNKMRTKQLDFEQVYDVRALRIIVGKVADCYAALGIIHQLWSPIEGEFDDYIAQPKSNDYRSLHTAVVAEDGRSMEVQIRTREMDKHAELGVAAHWRYKEANVPTIADSSYDNKIALLRQLLTWRDEVTDSAAWVEQFKRAALDDTIYVLTPQGRVVDLPHGATPIDFAYRLHTDLGHRCRGARVNGQMWPLNRPLANGQTVEISAVREGGPSRDWLNPAQGYLATPGARRKVRQWFSAQESAATLVQGRAFIARELQREGQTQINLDELAGKLGFRNVDAMFAAAGHGELGPRQIQLAVRAEAPVPEPAADVITKRSRAGDSQVLLVGVDKLMTQLGRCCKPAPPDAILGFVTRGRGVSIHRNECVNFRHLAKQHPERVIAAEWGKASEGVYAIDLQIEAHDRQGLLRDISELLSREKINVTAVKTLSSKDGTARMNFTVEMNGIAVLKRVLGLLRKVPGVYSAQRV